jgi:hypothetical protein
MGFDYDTRSNLFALLDSLQLKGIKDMNGQPKDVFVVMEGSKVSGIYQWREDAKAHAVACGGNVIVQQLRFETPGWVKTMNESAQEKARLQGGIR